MILNIFLIFFYPSSTLKKVWWCVSSIQLQKIYFKLFQIFTVVRLCEKRNHLPQFFYFIMWQRIFPLNTAVMAFHYRFSQVTKKNIFWNKIRIEKYKKINEGLLIAKTLDYAVCQHQYHKDDSSKIKNKSLEMINGTFYHIIQREV